MNAKRTAILASAVFAASLVSSSWLPRCAAIAAAPHQAQSANSAGPASSAKTRLIGAIKAINGSTITLAPDSGVEIQVDVQAGARIRQIAPGEKDPKNATPIQLQDLQVGDRILIAGKAADDGKSVAASDVLAMKRSDIEARHQQEQQDWQKRGLGGTVRSVDAASGTVTISVAGFGGSAKSVAVHATKATVVRRYAPDSVQFDAAKPSTLAEIQVGDQLRARGDRSADGAEFAAEEIVAGTFRNIAGIVNSVDTSANTINVQDLMTKKPIQVKITADSQMHKLPPEMAQRMAMRLKGAATGGAPGAGATPAAGSSANTQNAHPAAAPGGAGSGGAGGGMRSSGAPDINQMLSRQPTIALTDLHKGDAVVLVATEGSSSTSPTAIMLVSGVEPLLQAAPSASQALMLTPWTLGGAPAGDAGP
jgi:Domain of unknown function (DUF5666)